MLVARHASRLAAATRAVAAIEFALVAPVAATMLAGVYDISKALVIWEQVENTAHLVAVSASTVSYIDKDRTTILSVPAAQQSMSIIYAEMPWVADGLEQGLRSVTLTSVGFIPKGNNCTVTATENCYSPYIAWSDYYAGGAGKTKGQFQNKTRGPCGAALTQIPPQVAYKPGQDMYTTLRTANVAQPDAMLVADVHYTYTPFLFSFITGSIDFYVTNNWPARIGSTTTAPGLQYTTYSGANCPAPPAPPS